MVTSFVKITTSYFLWIIGLYSLDYSNKDLKPSHWKKSMNSENASANLQSFHVNQYWQFFRNNALLKIRLWRDPHRIKTDLLDILAIVRFVSYKEDQTRCFVTCKQRFKNYRNSWNMHSNEKWCKIVKSPL